MIREEAITVLKAFMENPLFSEVHKAAFNIAIHDIKAYQDWNINNLILVNKDNYEALEQEPTEWKQDHAILKAHSDGANEVLDKLRAEIDKIYEREGNSFDCLNALDELKEFIDKYKAEKVVEDGKID